MMRGDLQYRELADGGVIYDTSAERIHTLNLTAAYIWNCCDGAHDLPAIVSELEREAGVAREQAVRDVAALIGYFRREGLLVS